MSWKDNWKKRMFKNDLAGIPCVILDDRPPKEGYKGMLELEIMDTRNSAIYRVLVTARDVDTIVSIVEKGLKFTFDDHKPYANVATYIEKTQDAQPTGEIPSEVH